MNFSSYSFGLSLFLLSSALPWPDSAQAADYQSELYQSTKLVYEDHFDGALNTEYWEVRQSST